MQRNYCDRCGQECVNYKGMLNVHEEHRTNQGEQLEEAYMRHPKDLCKHCTESLEAWFGSSLGIMGEAALVAMKYQDRDRDDIAVSDYPAIESAHP